MRSRNHLIPIPQRLATGPFLFFSCSFANNSRPDNSSEAVCKTSCPPKNHPRRKRTHGRACFPSVIANNLPSSRQLVSLFMQWPDSFKASMIGCCAYSGMYCAAIFLALFFFASPIRVRIARADHLLCGENVESSAPSDAFIFPAIKTDSSRATEMDVTMIGLQNAGKTSLLRVLAVCSSFAPTSPMRHMLMLFVHAGWRIYHRVSIPSVAPCIVPLSLSSALLSSPFSCESSEQFNPHRWFQHEASPEGSCDSQVVSISVPKR